MNGFEKNDFVPISIDDLVVRCSQFADQFIERGDILPPKDWFEEGRRSETRISFFDMDLMGRITAFFLRVWKLIRFEEPWSPTLPNAFALRCIALFAERHLRLAFLNEYDTTKIMLSAVDKDRAFYWALTSFWRYSNLADRMVVVKEELQRLRYKHDISLLNDKWQRGKTGNLLVLEQDKRKEREARHALQACIAKVEETEALISNRKKKR